MKIMAYFLLKGNSGSKLNIIGQYIGLNC